MLPILWETCALTNLHFCWDIRTMNRSAGQQKSHKNGRRKVSLGACSSFLGEPRYPIRECLIVDGLATVVAALFGSPFGTCVYCGHPQFKQQARCTFGELCFFFPPGWETYLWLIICQIFYRYSLQCKKKHTYNYTSMYCRYNIYSCLDRQSGS